MPAPPYTPDAPLSIVLNAGSGRDDADAACTTIGAELEQAGRRHTIHRIDDPGRHEQVVAAAVAEAKARGGVLVAAGGDGTLNSVASQALEHRLPFGALPIGTFNLFGRDHGISEDVAVATRGLATARLRPVQVGRVAGRLFLVNASLGLYPALLEQRERSTDRFGRSRVVAFLSGLYAVVRHRGTLDIDIDGGAGSHRVRTRSLFIGNNRLQLDRIGIGDVDPAVDDTLTAVVVRPIGWLAMLGLALRGALGRLGQSEHVDAFEFRRLSVSPRRSRRIKVATDGEVAWFPAPLVFEVAPEPLWLLAPEAP